MRQGPLIKFSLGMPDKRLLGRALVEEAARAMLQREEDDEELLNYGDEQGRLRFRRSVCRLLGQGEQEARHVFGTQGNSHALSSVCCALLRGRAGSARVLVEQPVYMFGMDVLRDHVGGAQLVGVDAGDAQALRRAAREHRPAFMYLVPSFQNPTSRSLSEAQRRETIRIAHQHDFFLVCDDVYQLLAFDEEHREPSMASLDYAPYKVLSLGTFSKLCSPTLRCGWIETRNEDVMRLLCSTGQVMSGGQPLSASIMSAAIDSGALARHLVVVRRVLAERCAAMCEELRACPWVEFEEVNGGYFVWCHTPLVSAAQLQAALAESVTFWAGDAFCLAGSRFPNHFRLSFAFYDIPEIRKGTRLLCDAVRRLSEQSAD